MELFRKRRYYTANVLPPLKKARSFVLIKLFITKQTTTLFDDWESAVVVSYLLLLKSLQ